MENITIGNKKIVAVEEYNKEKGCENCFFFKWGDCYDIRQLIGECSSDERPDGKEIIYKEVPI